MYHPWMHLFLYYLCFLNQHLLQWFLLYQWFLLLPYQYLSLQQPGLYRSEWLK